MIIPLLLFLAQQPDLVLFIADDIGREDQIEMVEELTAIGQPSHIELLAAAGTRYTQTRASPVCSPTRRMLQSGRWCFFDSGVPCGPTLPTAMPAGLTLGAVAKLSGYHTGFFGKWHIGPNPDSQGRWEDTPAVHGYDRAVWTPWNMLDPTCGSTSYTDWVKVSDGVVSQETGYSPSVFEADFAAWWAATPSPKLAVFSPNWAHGPFAYPDSSLLPAGWNNPGGFRAKFLSMCAGLDLQVGRVRALAGAGAVIAFVSDNGTPANVSPPDHNPGCGQHCFFPIPAKGTTMERGVLVDMVLTGPGVPVGTDARMASPVDVLPALCALMGAVPPSGIPGTNLLQPATRNYVLVGNASGLPLDDMAAIGKWPGYLFKLRAQGAPGAITWTLYNLLNDPYEYRPLNPGMYLGVSNYLYAKLQPEMPL